MSVLRHLWLALAYYLSWLLFGLGGLALNLVCAPFLLFPDRERFGPAARTATRWMFDFWLRWMHASGVVEVVFHGFESVAPAPPRGSPGPAPAAPFGVLGIAPGGSAAPASKPEPTAPSPGIVYVANHPTLVDAPFLLARLPDTVCIFKPALLRNPVIAPAALLCGYVSGDAGVDGIRRAAEAVAAGRSLLIFPEGTRTVPGSSLNPLKPGAALIARRAGAPLRLIHVTSSPLMARKGHPWWKLPPLPGRFEFTLGELIPVDPAPSTVALLARVEEGLSAKPTPASSQPESGGSRGSSRTTR